MSVRKVLENFLEHVKKLEIAEEEGAKGNFSREFQYLKKKSGIYLRDGTYPAKEGEKNINRAKNRYKDILPFDYTRVHLNPLNGEEGSDYINANFLKGSGGQPGYIAAQGPLPGTVTDFWRMVWQFNTKIIVMASNEYEAGKHKCQRYWPVEDEEKHFLDMKVTLMQEESHTEFVMRTINVEKEDENRTLLQFHYTSWPDHGVPSSTRPMLDMIALVREFQPGNDPPIVIHCSAGCGRTGTICAIDYAWNLLKTGKLTSNFSLYKIISEMRRQRPSIVQAKDQYVIAHKAVSELFERHLDMMNQHFYENVEYKGQQPLSPGGESPSSDAGQLPYDSSYEDLASPIVRIELAPPAKLLKRRSMIVENATSPTHKAVKCTVAQIIKSESDNDLKAGTSQLKCVTPTLETKFSFELEDLDANAPSSPTKITVTDGDSLLPEGTKSDMLSSSSHSVESGYSSTMGGVGRGAIMPPGEELELSSHVTNIHISGEGDSHVSYQQEHTIDDKTVTQVFDESPRRRNHGSKGHLSPTKGQGQASQSFIPLPGTHERETCTDDISIPSVGSDIDDTVFEDNPMYGSSSSANGQFHNVPTICKDDGKNSHVITTPSPSKIKDIVSELNRSISGESAHHSGSNLTHSKRSPVKVPPKPAERNLSGKRQGFMKKSAEDKSLYGDVVAPNAKYTPNERQFVGDSDPSEYAYAETYTHNSVSDASKPVEGGYCYVDPNQIKPRNPLQAAAQKIISETHQNDQSIGSTGAKPKLPQGNPPTAAKRPPVKVPMKPPRKSKPPSTNVFNSEYEDVEIAPDGTEYEPVSVQDVSSQGIPKCASPRSSGEDMQRLQPVAQRRQNDGSSGSSAEDVYALVQAKTPVSRTSHESSDDDDAPPVPLKSSKTYKSSSEESLNNQPPESPEDLLKTTARAFHTLGRGFKKKVREAFGGNTLPASNERKVSSAPAVVIFKGNDISYGNRVARPTGPRITSKFTPMPAPRSK